MGAADTVSQCSIASLFFHVFVRQMSWSVFRRARLTLHVLVVHPLARREVLGIAWALGTVSGRPFRLSGSRRRRLGSSLRHRDGRDAEQGNGKQTAADR